MGKPPAVIEGTFELPSGRVVSVGDPSWFNWLDDSDSRSFRFDGRSGHFTARKETPKAGRPYWTAARRQNSKLHKCYLGHSGTLVLTRLEEAAEKLANPEVRERKKPAGAIQSVAPAVDSVAPLVDSVTPLVDSVTPALALNLADNKDFQQLQAQVTELHNRVSGLSMEFHNALDNFGGAVPEKGSQALLEQLAEVTEERESLKQRNVELEDRLADLAARAGEAFEANKQLRQQLAEVKEERDSFGQQLAAARVENLEVSRRNLELDSEASELAAKVGDLDLENQELRQQLAATVAERDALSRQLAEKDSVVEAQLRTGIPAATESAAPPDMPAIRERVLAGLKLGRQAPGYKAAAKALAAFEEALKGLPLVRTELPICAADLDPGDFFEKLREAYGTGPQKGRLPRWLDGLTDGQALPAILNLVAWFQQDPRFRVWETEEDHIREVRKQWEETKRQNDLGKGVPNKYPHNAGIFD